MHTRTAQMVVTGPTGRIRSRPWAFEVEKPETETQNRCTHRSMPMQLSALREMLGGTNQGGDSLHFLHQLGSTLRATGGRVSYYPVLLSWSHCLR